MSYLSIAMLIKLKIEMFARKKSKNGQDQQRNVPFIKLQILFKLVYQIKGLYGEAELLQAGPLKTHRFEDPLWRGRVIL